MSTYADLSALPEKARLAALEWLAKKLVYISDGFGKQAETGSGLLLWDDAWEQLTDRQAGSSAESMAPWEEGLRRFVGELGYGFGAETVNSEGLYIIRLEPLPGSPNPPILLVRGTEPQAKGDGDLVPPDLLTDAHPLSIGFNQLYSNSTRSLEDLQNPLLRPEVEKLLAWAKTWDQQGRPPILVAHSLGGALVQLLQVELALDATRVEQVVGFNAPGIHQALLNRAGLNAIQDLRIRPNTYIVNDGDFVQMAGQVVIPGDVYNVAFASGWEPDAILGRHLPTVLDVAGWGGVRTGIQPLEQFAISSKVNSAFYESYLFNYLGEVFKDADYLLGFQSYIIVGELLARSAAEGAAGAIPDDVKTAVTDWREQAEAAIRSNPTLNRASSQYAGRSLAFETLDAIGALLTGLPNGIGGLLTFRGTTEYARSIAGDKLFALMDLIPDQEAERLRFKAELAVLIEQGLKQVVQQTPAVLDYLYGAVADAISNSTTFIASGGLNQFAEQSRAALVTAAANLGSDLVAIGSNLPDALRSMVELVAEGIQSGLSRMPLVSGKKPDLTELQQQLLAGIGSFQELLAQTIRAGNEDLVEEALFVAMASHGVPLIDRNQDGVVNRADLDVSTDDSGKLRLQFAVGDQLNDNIVEFEEETSSPLGSIKLRGDLQGELSYRVNLDISLSDDLTFGLNENVTNDLELVARVAPSPGSILLANAGPFRLDLRDRGSVAEAQLSIDLKAIDQAPVISGNVGASLKADFATSTAAPSWLLEQPTLNGGWDLQWSAATNDWTGLITVPGINSTFDITEFNGTAINWEQVLPLLTQTTESMVSGAVERYLDRLTNQLTQQLKQLPVFDLVGAGLPDFTTAGQALDYVLRTFSDFENIASSPQSESVLERLTERLLDQRGYAGLYSGLDINLQNGGLELAITLNPQWSATIPLQQDFGFDNLGLNLAGTAAVNATGTLSPSLALKLGVDSQGGFYIDTAELNEFSLSADLSIPGSSVTAELGAYNLSATDNGSFLKGLLTLDIQDSKDTDQQWRPGEEFLVTPDFDLNAALALNLEASSPANSYLPGIRGDLTLASVMGSNLSDWSIKLDDVEVNLGGAADLLQPLADGIDLAIRPLRPVISFLDYKPVRALLDQAKALTSGDWTGVGKNAVSWTEEQLGSWADVNMAYLLDLADLVQSRGVVGAERAVRAVENPLRAYEYSDFKFSRATRILKDVDSLNTTFSAIDDQGWMAVQGDPINIESLPSLLNEPLHATPALNSTTLSIDKIIASRISDSNEDAKDIFAQVLGITQTETSVREQSTAGINLNIPVLSNPASAFGLLFGQPVDLFTVDIDIPKLSFNIANEVDIPIFPLLGIWGVARAGFGLDLELGSATKPEFGIDTTGLYAHYLDPANSSVLEALKEGIYFLAGEPLFSIDPSLSAELGVYLGAPNTPKVGEVGLNPRLTGNFDVGLQDVDGDGKFRLSDWVNDDLLANFFATADINFDLDAYWKIFDGALGGKIDLYSANLWNWSSIQSGASQQDVNRALAPVEEATPVDNTIGVLSNRQYRLLSGPLATEATFKYQSGIDSFRDDSDLIIINTTSDGQLQVSNNGQTQVLDPLSLSAFEVNAGDFDDQIQVDPSINIAVHALGDNSDGVAGNDWIETGAGNDILEGEDGDDTLRGADGNDVLIGGAGNDELDGGQGSDTISGNSGNDFIEGGDDDDVIHPGSGNDRVYAGAGNDFIGDLDSDPEAQNDSGDDWVDGEAGNDTIAGGAGHDTLLGGAGDDLLSGGEGNDILVGGDGRDQLYGNAGDDYLLGSDDDDELYGGENNDTLSGGNGNDLLSGGDGDDRFIVSNGDDIYDGGTTYGSDLDTLDGSESASGLFVYLNISQDVENGHAGLLYKNYAGENPTDFIAKQTDSTTDRSLLRNIEQVKGSAQSDYINGGEVKSSANSNSRGVTFFDSDGNDTLVGTNREDVFVLDGSTGVKIIDGGANIDRLEVVAASSWSGPTVQPTYRPGDDLGQPSSIWSYGFRPANAEGIFLEVGSPGTSNTDDGRLRGYTSTSSGAVLTTNYTDSDIGRYDRNVPPGDLFLHPGNNGERPVIRFKAPVTGFYSLEGYFEDAHTSYGDGGTGDILLLSNDGQPDSLWTRSWRPSDSSDRVKQIFSIDQLRVNEGEVIEFRLGMNAAYDYDSTIFGATIDLISQIYEGSKEIFIDGRSVSVRDVSDKLANSASGNLRLLANLSSIEHFVTGDGNDSIRISDEAAQEGVNYWIQAGHGNDILEGGNALNILDGGSGNNTYYINQDTDIIYESGRYSTVISSISLDLNADKQSSGERTELKKIYNATLVNTEPNNSLSLTDNALNNRIIGSDFNDRIMLQHGGRDTVDGGAGNDTVIVSIYADGQSLEGGPGVDTLDLTQLSDLTINANSGKFEFWQGSGNLRYKAINSFNSFETILLSKGNTVAYGSDTLDIHWIAAERTLDGTGYSLNGGEANEIYEITLALPVAGQPQSTQKAIRDVVLAGKGDDLLIMDWSKTDQNIRRDRDYYGRYYYTANLNESRGIAQHYLTFDSVERFHLTGGSADDDLYGGDSNDTLSGGAGNDRLEAARGAGVFDGGSGVDLFIGSFDNTDQQAFVLNLADAQASAQQVLSGTELASSFSSIEYLHLTTGNGNDQLDARGIQADSSKLNQAGRSTVHAGHSWTSGDGDDTFSIDLGSTGNHLFQAGAGDDLLLMDWSAASDAIRRSSDYYGRAYYSTYLDPSDPAQTLTYTEVERFHLTGGSADDDLYGGDSTDTPGCPTHLSRKTHATASCGLCWRVGRDRGGSSTLENQVRACLCCALRLGMQGSSSCSGIGSQAINLAVASATTICRAPRPRRRKLMPRFQCGSTCRLRPARLRA